MLEKKRKKEKEIELISKKVLGKRTLTINSSQQTVKQIEVN